MTDPTPHPAVPLPADAEYDDVADRWTLVLTRDFRQAPDLVWAALTEPAQLARWAPFEAARDLAELGDLTLTMVDGDERTDLPASVVRAEAPRLLEYHWGPDLLRWELEATPDGTRLTLRHTVEDRDGLSKAAAGWHLCLEVAQRMLDGEQVEPVRGAAAMEQGWGDLNEAYAAKLGVSPVPGPPAS